MPPAIRKHGLPKGAEKTVIGLPRKKLKGSVQIKKPVPFLRKYPADQDTGMSILVL